MPRSSQAGSHDPAVQHLERRLAGEHFARRSIQFLTAITGATSTPTRWLIFSQWHVDALQQTTKRDHGIMPRPSQTGSRNPACEHLQRRPTDERFARSFIESLITTSAPTRQLRFSHGFSGYSTRPRHRLVAPCLVCHPERSHVHVGLHLQRRLADERFARRSIQSLLSENDTPLMSSRAQLQRQPAG